MIAQSSRLRLVAKHDPQSAAALTRLIEIALKALPEMQADGEFVFTLNGMRRPDGTWQTSPTGLSLRYGAIVALGAARLPEPAQREVLAGDTCYELVGRLAKRLDEITNPGDAALLSWAAAEVEHSELPRALGRLGRLSAGTGLRYVLDAAWTVSAYTAARRHADVEQNLAHARGLLLAARTGALYPHIIGGRGPWYRGHVGSFADQVYPVQALARLHGSGDDPQALATADAVAAGICAAQGSHGQWWWHYDSRTGEVIEGYPVYSVHQHAMAPMALLDLAEADGAAYLGAVCRGLRWLAAPPEVSEDLVLDDPAITWRKVSRADPRKIVRGARAVSARLRPRLRLGVLDRLFPPVTVDHECRPYELGWLLATWL
jgi:hypothetical protein